MATRMDPKRLAKHGAFAARLRRLMQEKGLRNKDLAVLLGEKPGSSAAQTNVSTWVRALGMPGNVYRAPLAKALGVTMEELYERTEPTKVVALVQRNSPGEPVKARSQALVPVPVNGKGHPDNFEMFSVMVTQGTAELELRVRLPVAELDRAIFGLRQLGLVR